MTITRARVSEDYVRPTCSSFSTSSCGTTTRKRISSDYIKPVGTYCGRSYSSIYYPSFSWGWNRPSFTVVEPAPVVAASCNAAEILGATLVVIGVIALVAIAASRGYCHTEEVCKYIGVGLEQCHLEQVCVT